MKLNITSVIVCISLFYQLQTYGQLATGNESYQISTLWETNDYELFTDNVYTPVIRYKDAIYFVYVDGNFKAQVGKYQNGQTTIRQLSNDNLTVRDDGHHKFSMGIDKNGYLHIAGDMHHHPASNKNHLPSNYQNSIVMYWVSDQPESIDNFSFMGFDEDRAIPGYGFSYYSFQMDMNQELYFMSRIRVHENGHHPGEMGLALFKYDVDTQSWTGLGGMAPTDRGAEYPCILWEDNAHSSTSFYQTFKTGFKFDFNNRLHVGSLVNNNSSFDDPTDLVYGYSDDGGLSFNKADGTPIPNLPMRAENHQDQGDMLETNTEIVESSFPFFNIKNEPIVLYTMRNWNANYNMDWIHYKKWNSSTESWGPRTKAPVTELWRTKYHCDNRGILTCMSANVNGNMRRANEIDGDGYSFVLGRRLMSVDEFSIHDHGAVLGFAEDDGKLLLTEVTFDTELEDLGTLWSNTTLGQNSEASAGWIDQVMEIENQGMGALGKSDAGGFTYQQIIGDLELTARIINVGYAEEAAETGLMVRASMDDNSAMAMAGITYNQGARMSSRITTGSQVEEVVKEEYRPAEWLKITRQGDFFSTYRSDNGLDWDHMETKEIDMNATVYVGIFGASGSSSKSSRSHIDNISLENTVVTSSAGLHTPITISLFPNPATKRIQLSTHAHWELYNSLGELLSEGEGNEIRLNEKWPTGTYSVKVGDLTVPFVKN